MGIILDVTFDDKELLAALERAPDEVYERGWEIVRERSFAVERQVKDDMPVDTGRARASWGHWSPDRLVQRAGGGTDPAAKAEDAVFKEDPRNLSVTQGTNVPYVTDLNAGSSTQMSAGFIDRAAEHHAAEMEKDLGNLVEGLI